MVKFYPESNAPLKQIKGTEFGILSPEVLRNYSVAKIEYVEMYENKQPKVGGLSDPRMGCIEKNMQCYTCQDTINNCPGHFGHIELNSAVYHIGFLKTVKKILECICHKCSRFRLLPSDTRYKKLLGVKDKFQYAWEYCKSKTVCEYDDCEAQLLPLRRYGMQLYYDGKRVDKSLDKVYLYADEVLRILSGVSDETCRLIGINPETSRPEWMIITVLPVPPPCVRPSVKMDLSEGRGEDDLTHVLINIIRYNNELKKYSKSGTASNVVAEMKEKLQFHIATYFDNDLKTGIPQNMQRGSRPIKSISSRLKGKEGRIRCHLMGKRVDFSARTVITGDPHISLEQVGIPRSIASNLTFPETVFNLNITKMQNLVDKSPVYPSAKYLVRKDGTRFDLRFGTKKPRVDIGDIVERHLVDDDIVLFNRQPTLHKMSMMSHRVKVMDHSTFRLNVNVCASYNADFDGDEMNIHVPQSLDTIAELMELSSVSKNLISAQANKPVNSLVQDTLSGLRIFTQRDTFLTREEVMRLLVVIDSYEIPMPAILKPIPLWTGKQIMTILLPKIDFMGYHSAHPTDEIGVFSPGDTRVVIYDGQLISGIICKKTIGTSSGGILHIIFNDINSDRALLFLDQVSQVVNEWLLHHGFSVGIGDALITEKENVKMNASRSDNFTKVDGVLDRYRSGSLAAQGTLSVEKTKENMIQSLLSKARDEAGTLVYSSVGPQNNIKQMVEAGSKGSIMNICQISACVGQQVVEGKRLHYGFKDRTLPCFNKFDDSPESRGYVINSFLRGLSPQEMFFHAMGGREGVIDTAVKTSETGYIQRRLVKSMEDLIVQIDGTVCDSNGSIIQFIYGEDGIDGTCIEWNTFPTMFLSNSELLDGYYTHDQPQEWDLLCEDQTHLRNVLKDDRYPMPLNIQRLLVKAARDTGTKDTLPGDYIFEKVLALRKKLVPKEYLWKKSLFGALLTSYLSTRQIMYRHKLDKLTFDTLLHVIESKYYKSLACYGENVGVIAAQSIGEPATQMTLNTFHLSGTGNKTVTSGIPRLKELINAAKNIKTPGMVVYFDENIRFDRDKVQDLQYSIQHTCLKDVTEACSIIYDPDINNSCLTSDRYFLDVLNSIPNDDLVDNLHPWVIKLILSRKELFKRNLYIREIVQVVEDLFDSDVFIQSSHEICPELVIHIRFIREDTCDKGKDMIVFLKNLLDNTLEYLTICGIPGIEKTFVTEKQVVLYDQNGKQNAKEYVIETDGINLKEVGFVLGVDISRLICNDPLEMNNTFGIEISREVLLSEIKHVITDSGAFINDRHLKLLCDIMTSKGYIMSITRHGMNKSDINPLSKCTFEQSVDILLEAAKEGINNQLNGISENIMVGKVVNSGTGMVDILEVEEEKGYHPLKPSYLSQ